MEDVRPALTGPRERFGDRLRAVREQRGLTQKEAADKVRMGQPQYSQLERANDLTLTTFKRLLRVFPELHGALTSEHEAAS